MSKRIDIINDFRFPISQPTVFDEEELTVLEVASRNTEKTNEVVDYLNDMLDGEITEQIGKKISQGVIDSAYDKESETLFLKIKYPESEEN